MAGYFLDITDPVNFSESDSVALPGSWFANVLSGCVYLIPPGAGVSEVAGWKNCFDNHTSSIAFNPAVTFPSGWNPATLDVLYNRNINGVQ